MGMQYKHLMEYALIADNLNCCAVSKKKERSGDQTDFK